MDLQKILDDNQITIAQALADIKYGKPQIVAGSANKMHWLAGDLAVVRIHCQKGRVRRIRITDPSCADVKALREIAEKIQAPQQPLPKPTVHVGREGYLDLSPLVRVWSTTPQQLWATLEEGKN